MFKKKKSEDSTFCKDLSNFSTATGKSSLLWRREQRMIIIIPPFGKSHWEGRCQLGANMDSLGSHAAVCSSWWTIKLWYSHQLKTGKCVLSNTNIF